MSYEVRFSGQAEKDFSRLDRITRERVERRTRALAESPHDYRLGKLLKGANKIRSSRVGSWRVLYSVNEETKQVNVIAIRPRGQAYRDL